MITDTTIYAFVTDCEIICPSCAREAGIDQSSDDTYGVYNWDLSSYCDEEDGGLYCDACGECIVEPDEPDDDGPKHTRIFAGDPAQELPEDDPLVQTVRGRLEKMGVNFGVVESAHVHRDGSITFVYQKDDEPDDDDEPDPDGPDAPHNQVDGPDYSDEFDPATGEYIGPGAVPLTPDEHKAAQDAFQASWDAAHPDTSEPSPEREWTQSDITGAIIAWESDELDTPGSIKLFGELVRTGLAWSLQGTYGRTAQSLIESGFIARDGTVNWEGVNEYLDQ